MREFVARFGLDYPSLSTRADRWPSEPHGIPTARGRRRWYPSTVRSARPEVEWLPGTRRDAERALTEALHQRDKGIDLISGDVTVADFLQRWLRDYAEPSALPTWQTIGPRRSRSTRARRDHPRLWGTNILSRQCGRDIRARPHQQSTDALNACRFEWCGVSECVRVTLRDVAAVRQNLGDAMAHPSRSRRVVVADHRTRAQALPIVGVKQDELPASEGGCHRA